MCGDYQAYIEPSNYFSGILFCFLLYVLYALVTMYLYFYVCTWILNKINCYVKHFVYIHVGYGYMFYMFV